jgi:hypothetical protein
MLREQDLMESHCITTDKRARRWNYMLDITPLKPFIICKQVPRREDRNHTRHFRITRPSTRGPLHFPHRPLPHLIYVVYFEERRILYLTSCFVSGGNMVGIPGEKTGEDKKA